MSTRSIAAAAAVVSLSLSAAALPGYAQAAGTELTEVVVTATRTRTPLAELAVPVVVIDRAAIENALALDAAELIAALPGVEVARTGGASTFIM